MLEEYNENEINNYDYIIRTNISTIIDFNLLASELEKTPISNYGSTHTLNLCWLDRPSGIIDNTYFNTTFASGTNIILSKNGCKLLIDNSHILNKTILDDVSIGILFKQLNIKCDSFFVDKFIIVPILNNEDDYKVLMNNNYFVYRNCNGETIDLLQMKNISELLIIKNQTNL